MPGALQGLRCRIIATTEPRMTDSFAAQLADALGASWPAIARPNQLPPPGEWQIWLLLAGGGCGKTRTLAEWVCQQAASGQAGRIALVTATAADARDVLVEGQSGILAMSPPWFRPVYEPSKRRLTWPNGAIATTFSAEEPDRLRGPQHDEADLRRIGLVVTPRNLGHAAVRPETGTPSALPCRHYAPADQADPRIAGQGGPRCRCDA